MVSGLATSAEFTSTTSPATGENSSETAFTDSTVPKLAWASSLRPTSGSSRYTTSPSCFCAYSVIPMVPRSPVRRTHSCCFV